MHWFLIIYMFSTDDLLVTEVESKKECIQLKKKFIKTLKNNKDIKSIECEEGEIMDSYKKEEDKESETL